MTKLTIKESVESDRDTYLVDFLAEHTSLSKSQIKKALIYGGAWVKKSGTKKLERCRKAKRLLKKKDYVEFYFDDKLLDEKVEPPQQIEQYLQWSVWYKPVNMLSQGSKYGDATSLESQVAKLSGNRTYLIHRLDREASGIIVVAYEKSVAAELSKIWREGHVRKIYQIEVLGTPTNPSGEITEKLDGKDAKTSYRVIENRQRTSLLEVEISTGRFHQIRRHMESIGHPVMGDPRYGSGNKNTQGLQLVASRIVFEFNKAKVDCQLDQSLRLK